MPCLDVPQTGFAADLCRQFQPWLVVAGIGQQAGHIVEGSEERFPASTDQQGEVLRMRVGPADDPVQGERADERSEVAPGAGGVDPDRLGHTAATRTAIALVLGRRRQTQGLAQIFLMDPGNVIPSACPVVPFHDERRLFAEPTYARAGRRKFARVDYPEAGDIHAMSSYDDRSHVSANGDRADRAALAGAFSTRRRSLGTASAGTARPCGTGW